MFLLIYYQDNDFHSYYKKENVKSYDLKEMNLIKTLLNSLFTTFLEVNP